MMAFKMYLLSDMAILGIHVSFRGCNASRETGHVKENHFAAAIGSLESVEGF